MNVELVEMSAEDYRRRLAELLGDSVRSLAISRGLSVPEAEAAARRGIAGALPDGPGTPGQILRTAVHGTTPVGWIWVSLPDVAVPGMAWISDIVVDEPYRRRGYGEAIIQAAECDLVQRGVTRLGLNVYGDNRTARRLYERLGFGVIRQVRARTLDDVPAMLSAVTLVPIAPADYERRIAATEAAYPPERQVRKSMPDGPATDGMIVRTVLAAGVPVGWVWYGLRGPDRPGLAWIYQLDVDQPYRSRGYGTAVIAAVEADLVRRGARGVGLYVRGDNLAAQRLYERLGFKLISQEMSKPLPAP